MEAAPAARHHDLTLLPPLPASVDGRVSSRSLDGHRSCCTSSESGIRRAATRRRVNASPAVHRPSACSQNNMGSCVKLVLGIKILSRRLKNSPVTSLPFINHLLLDRLLDRLLDCLPSRVFGWQAGTKQLDLVSRSRSRVFDPGELRLYYLKPSERASNDVCTGEDERMSEVFQINKRTNIWRNKRDSHSYSDWMLLDVCRSRLPNNDSGCGSDVRGGRGWSFVGIKWVLSQKQERKLAKASERIGTKAHWHEKPVPRSCRV